MAITPSDLDTMPAGVVTTIKDGHEWFGFTEHPSWCDQDQCQSDQPFLEDLLHICTVSEWMTLSLYEETPRTEADLYCEGPESLEVTLQQNGGAMDADPEVHLFRPNADQGLNLTLQEAIALTYMLHRAVTMADPDAGDLLPKGPLSS